MVRISRVAYLKDRFIILLRNSIKYYESNDKSLFSKEKQLNEDRPIAISTNIPFILERIKKEEKSKSNLK